MSTRMNIAVRGLFATPVAALEVPGAEARNAELSALILKAGRDLPRFRLPTREAGIQTARLPSGAARKSALFSILQRRWRRLTADRTSGPPSMERHGRTSMGPATRIFAITIRARSGRAPIMSPMAAALAIPVWAASSKCWIPAGPDPECTRRL